MTSELPEHLRAYQQSLYAALSNNDDTLSVRDASPLDQLSRLAEDALPIVAGEPPAQATLLALGAVGSWPDVPAAMQAADELFGTNDRFAEAIYLARTLGRDPETALAVVRGRRYLEEAVLTDSMAELVTDRYSLLTSSTFTQLWSPDSRPGAAVSSIEIWRSHYVASYAVAHESHRRAVAAVTDMVDEMTLRAEAIERLNTLRRLGAPVALTSLVRFHELERLYACTIDSPALTEALVGEPLCPVCRFVLGQMAPTLEARRLRQSIDRGLFSQLRRLSQRMIMRLLAQAQTTEEQRLARFIEVVQASDLDGLALVLDDELLEFLRRLLDPPPAHADLLDRLAASFPEVTLANLNDAVLEIGRLLSEDVVQSGGVLRIGPRRP